MGLRRAKRDRWISGVCGGIAQHFGWNSNVLRLVVVLLAIFIPGPNLVVLLAYILLAVLLPEGDF